MAFTILHKAWWHLYPLSRKAALRKLTNIENGFQNLLSATESKLKTMKPMIYKGISETTDEKKYIAIKKQVFDYNKRSWLVRAWWRLCRRKTDIPAKRLWLSYQTCKPLHGLVLANEAGVTENIKNHIELLISDTLILTP